MERIGPYGLIAVGEPNSMKYQGDRRDVTSEPLSIIQRSAGVDPYRTIGVSVPSETNDAVSGRFRRVNVVADDFPRAFIKMKKSKRIAISDKYTIRPLET